jgi:hypothetical protein
MLLQARDYLRDRGTLAILGLPPNAKLVLPILETMLRGIHVVGCFVGNRQDAVEALQLHVSGQVRTGGDTLYRRASNIWRSEPCLLTILPNLQSAFIYANRMCRPNFDTH